MTTQESTYARTPNRRPKSRFYARRKVCAFCVNAAESKKSGSGDREANQIDYKNVEMLRKYVSDRYKIKTKRRTGTCSKCQRALATAIKRDRFLALLPYTPNHQGVYTGTR